MQTLGRLPTETKAKQAGYKEAGRFGVLVHPVGEMPNREWDEIVLQLKSQAPLLRVLVIWAEGTLTPKQRIAVQAIQKTSAMRVVLFTDSAVTRGVMKVLQWFAVKAEVFPKAQLTASLEKVGATPVEIQNVRTVIRELERMLDWSVGSDNRIAIKPSSTRDS